MSMKFLTLAIVALAITATFADGVAEGEVVKEEGRGRLTLSAGPAWRSSVKMETRGTLVAPAPVRNSVRKRDMAKSENWTGATLVADPYAGMGGIPSDGKLWGVSDTRTMVYGKAGADYSVNASDDDSTLGFNLQGCYDLMQNKRWSVGLNFRFAAYGNMKSESSGHFNAGFTRTNTSVDNYIFPDLAPDATFAPDPADAILENGSKLVNSVTDRRGSRAVSTRLCSDLYQIGLGPSVTWRPFVGWCGALSWLDLYGDVEILCNFAHTEFSADGSSLSQTDCLLGFGGNIGLVGNITDNVGIYGQVGYEWIDKSDASTGGFKAEVDYSSLVLSAGLQIRF